MTLDVPAAAARALDMRPRSVVPGRQRWEVTALRGRPEAARLVEEFLGAEPGVDGVTANPVTGRILVFHDRTLSTPEAAHRLRRAVVRAFARVFAPPPPRRGPSLGTAAARVGMRRLRDAVSARRDRAPGGSPRRGSGRARTGGHGEKGASAAPGGGGRPGGWSWRSAAGARDQGTGREPAKPGRARRGAAWLRHRLVAAVAAVAAVAGDASAEPGRTRDTGRWLRRSAVVAGAAVLAFGSGAAALAFLLRPFVSLGLVAATTAVIVRRAWRRSDERGRPARRRGMLRDIIGPYRRRFTLAAVTSVLAQTAEMTLGLFIAAIAVVLMQGENAALLSLGIAGAGAQLWWLAVGTAAVCAAVAALSYTSNLAWRRLARDVEYDWRNRTYAHAQRLSLGSLEGSRTSRVNSVLTDDVGRMGAFVAGTLPELVQMATGVLAVVPVFLVFAPQIAWVAFLPVPLVTWLSFRFHDRDAGDYAAAGETRGRLHSHMANTLQANSTVKASCTEDHEDARLADLGDRYRESTARTDLGAVRHTESVRLATTASMAGTLLFGGRAVLAGELPFQAFSPLVGLPQQVLVRLTRLGASMDQYRRTLDSYDRVTALHEIPVERAEPRTPAAALGPVRRPAGELLLDRVSFGYGEGPPVLHDLTLRIAAGRVTGIVGPTGSGKTTIARLLMRFEEPRDGAILLDGRDLRDIPLRDLRSTIGLVAQEPVLFDGTIADNVRYGSFDADDLRVAAGTRMAEADGFIRELPHRERTIVGERGSSLSGGQKQRVALARTILRNPPVVVLDEATSAVDNGTEAAIQRALGQFGAGRTMVVIAHRLSTVRDADWIYVLDRGGVLTEEGTHTQLVRRGGLYADLWRLQSGRPTATPPRTPPTPPRRATAKRGRKTTRAIETPPETTATQTATARPPETPSPDRPGPPERTTGTVSANGVETEPPNRPESPGDAAGAGEVGRSSVVSDVVRDVPPDGSSVGVPEGDVGGRPGG
ncbi:ABC transporter ATP-binding protein/permease [Yinghuangia sp. ASG 101]|uniref:ABC transporter ATP-binding protein/permease n=1 Tax=Yinghuangia sp. ASG 101 TaxID=2896848 RepID=UPI001E34275E|nr:ABC transporter ATP-binding protein/permease [Yinghuangia sp. ASG 101]UGQ11810.1 ABC transporter ATP-binding protein/permease [Yinghuangia sp. ASG 101]